MKRFVKNLFGTKAKTIRSRKPVRARLGMEALESRTLMAATLTANLSLVDSVLRIEGTYGDDQIRIAHENGSIRVEGISITLTGDDNPESAASVARTRVLRIEVAALDGNDVVQMNDVLLAGEAAVPMVIHGGMGNDNIQAGRGADIVYGEAGNDTIRGGSGADVLHGGANPAAATVVQDYQMRVMNQHTNFFGRSEKWVVPSFVYGQPYPYYYITPDGTLYFWNQDEIPEDPVEAVLDPSYYQDLSKLEYERGLYDLNLYVNWGMRGEKWLEGIGDRYENRFYFITPIGEVIRWDGLEEASGVPSTGELLTTLDFSYHVNPHELVNLADGDDFIQGQAGNDTLHGGDGSDALDGGIGGDQLRGGAGPDLFNNVDPRDTVLDAAAEDQIIRTGITAWLDTAYRVLHVQGTDASESYYLAHTGDSLFSSVAVEVPGFAEPLAFLDPATVLRIEIDMGGGNDEVLFEETGGLLPAAMVRGGWGNDTVTTGSGNDTLNGGTGDDSLLGMGGADLIQGSGDGLPELDDLAISLDRDYRFSKVGFVWARDGFFGDEKWFTGSHQYDGWYIKSNGEIWRSDSESYNFFVAKVDPYYHSHVDELIRAFDQPYARRLDEAYNITWTADDAVNDGTLGYNEKWVYANGDPQSNGWGFLVILPTGSVYYYDENADGGLGAAFANFDSSYHTDISKLWDAGFKAELPHEGGNDTLNGGMGDDTLLGTVGHDLLEGGAGIDQMDGGHGYDRLFGGADNDVMYGRQGNDSLDGGAGDDYAAGHDGDDTLIGGTGNDALWGDNGNDFLDGQTGDDKLRGRNGNDTIYGRGGRDDIEGGEGQDSINGGASSDVIYGDTNWAASPVSPIGPPGPDGLPTRIDRDPNNHDTIFGEGEDDLIYGGSGNDSLHGGAGNDVVYGGHHEDRIYGGAGRDSLWGDAGHDLLHGDSNLFTETSAPDLMHGGTGNDTLYGGASRDLIYGDLGADRLYSDGTYTLNYSRIERVGFDRLFWRTGTTDFMVGEDRARITELSTDKAWAPRFGQPGEVITVSGVGMTSGMQVRFGSETASPVVAPIFVSLDGTRMQVQVPRRAMSGRLTLVEPRFDGSLEVVAASPKNLEIKTYRNQFGFSFGNGDYTPSIALIMEAFGKDQTALRVEEPGFFEDLVESVSDVLTSVFGDTADDVLRGAMDVLAALSNPWNMPIPPGVLNKILDEVPGIKDTFGMIPTPQTLAFLIIAEVSLTQRCFGQALVSSQMASSGEVALGKAQDYDLMRRIEKAHLYQFSKEVINHSIRWVASSHGGGWNAGNVRSYIQEFLNKGEYPIINVNDKIGRGHSVVAYDISDAGDTPEIGDYYIHIYNPNRPWMPGESTSQATRDGGETLNRIRVLAGTENRWFYNHGTNGSPQWWEGGFGNMIVIPPSLIPAKPTFPGTITESDLRTLVIGNFGAGDLVSSTASMDAPALAVPEARVAELATPQRPAAAINTAASLQPVKKLDTVDLLFASEEFDPGAQRRRLLID